MYTCCYSSVNYSQIQGFSSCQVNNFMSDNYDDNAFLLIVFSLQSGFSHEPKSLCLTLVPYQHLDQKFNMLTRTDKHLIKYILWTAYDVYVQIFLSAKVKIYSQTIEHKVPVSIQFYEKCMFFKGECLIADKDILKNAKGNNMSSKTLICYNR